MKRYVLLLFGKLVLTLILAGCSTPVESLKEDSAPPAGYKPVYVSGITKVSELNIQSPSLSVSRVEAFDADSIRIYFNLLNSEGIMLTNALEGDWRRKWCSFTEEVNGRTYPVKDYLLAEVPGAIIRPIAISLVMDHSGSIGDDRANLIQGAAADLVRMKHADDAISIIKYDDKAVLEVPLTTRSEQLLGKLAPTGVEGYGGKSALTKAIFTGIDALAGATQEEKILIVYTDGNESSGSLDSLVEYALENDVTICAIDFGTEINKDFVKELAVLTGGTYNHMYMSSEFQRVYADIYRRVSHAYIFQYTPVEFGDHTVGIKFCMPEYEIETFASFNNTPEVNIPVLLSIYFDFGKYSLRPESDRALLSVVDLLGKYPQFKIDISGHTDNVGDKAFNLKLSQQRADAVKEELIKRGIDGTRITSKGFGDSQPAADNTTEEGRAANRRTEFVIRY